MSVKSASLKDFLTLPAVDVYDQERIKKNIPHREPFLLVDEVKVLEEKKKYLGKHFVRPDEYYFKGHFPARPVMPGVLVVESMSQAFGGAIMGYITQGKGGLPLFLSIENAKFRGTGSPRMKCAPVSSPLSAVISTALRAHSKSWPRLILRSVAS